MSPLFSSASLDYPLDRFYAMSLPNDFDVFLQIWLRVEVVEYVIRSDTWKGQVDVCLSIHLCQMYEKFPFFTLHSTTSRRLTHFNVSINPHHLSKTVTTHVFRHSEISQQPVAPENYNFFPIFSTTTSIKKKL